MNLIQNIGFLFLLVLIFSLTFFKKAIINGFLAFKKFFCKSDTNKNLIAAKRDISKLSFIDRILNLISFNK